MCIRDSVERVFLGAEADADVLGRRQADRSGDAQARQGVAQEGAGIGLVVAGIVEPDGVGAELRIQAQCAGDEVEPAQRGRMQASLDRADREGVVAVTAQHVGVDAGTGAVDVENVVAGA